MGETGECGEVSVTGDLGAGPPCIGGGVLETFLSSCLSPTLSAILGIGGSTGGRLDTAGVGMISSWTTSGIPSSSIGLE